MSMQAVGGVAIRTDIVESNMLEAKIRATALDESNSIELAVCGDCAAEAHTDE